MTTTYSCAIIPISYGDSVQKKKIKPEDLNLFFEGTPPQHEIDQIKALLSVSLNLSTENPHPYLCVMDESRKDALFRTFRDEQELDLILYPDDNLAERGIHFRRIEMIDSAHHAKGLRVEYLDTTHTPPRWMPGGPFGKNMPGKPQRIRLVFGLRGKEGPYAFNIYISDASGSSGDIPCDPQASNEPPNITP